MIKAGSILPKKTIKHPRKLPKKHPRNIQEEILNLLKVNPALTMNDLMHILRISEGSARHHLKKLKEEGKIVHRGATKAGYWEVIE